MEAREPLAIVFSFLHPESFPILESQMEWEICAGSDAGRLLYFSDAFLMHYQIGGDVPCSKEDILVVGGVICRKYLRWIINLLSRNLDCVENKRVKCERKNLFILIW